MNKPLNIVHIASGDLWAGAEVQLYHLAIELHRTTGIFLHIVLMNHGVLEDRLRQAGISVTIINEAQHSSLGICLQLIRVLRKLRPQIIHTHRGKENVLGSLASLLVPKTALVQTVHGASEHFAKPWQLPKNISAYMNSLCTKYLYSRIVAVSAPLASNLANRYSSAKVMHIDNGISVGVIQDLGARPAALPGANQRIKVGIIGRLVHVKRVDIFLRVARSLSASAPDRYAFYIFGDGPLHADLKQQALVLELGEHTHFMGFTSNVIPFLAALDLLLVTSDHEGLPMVLLEALCLSIPIIAPAVGGIPELLHNGQFGRLIKSNEHIEEYRDAITEFSRHPNTFHEMASAGLAAVNAHYSAYVISEQYCSMYRKLAQAASE